MGRIIFKNRYFEKKQLSWKTYEVWKFDTHECVSETKRKTSRRLNPILLSAS